MQYSKDILTNPEALVEIMHKNGCNFDEYVSKQSENKLIVSTQAVKQQIIGFLPKGFIEAIPSNMLNFFHQSIDAIVFQAIQLLAGECQRGDCKNCFLLKCCSISL
jgi:hypothetical protein